MTPLLAPGPPDSVPRQRGWIALVILGGVLGFQGAFLGQGLEGLVFVYLGCVFALRKVPTARCAFWSGAAIGLGVYVPQLWFLWDLFGIEVAGFQVLSAAVVLWLLLAAFHGFFVLLLRGVERRHGTVAAVVAAPVLWMGLEYLRSEIWWLRFAWFSVGEMVDAWTPMVRGAGVYGTGALLMSVVAVVVGLASATFRRRVVGFGLVLSLLVPAWRAGRAKHSLSSSRTVQVAGVQLESPAMPEVLVGLERVLGQHPGAQLIVLGEYTLDGPPPESLRRWCRQNQRWLIVGGTESVSVGDAGPSWESAMGLRGGKSAQFRNTAFVLGPDGEVDFTQAKSVPIQFFRDGLPAVEQRLWESPWGPLGVAVCYDVSYRRVMDRLVRMGAQGLVVIAMDAESWGRHEHELNARMSRLRTIEYGLPMLRVATSGISQVLAADGKESARANFPGPGETLGGTLRLAGPGRVPIDAWLAPLALGATVVVAALLAFTREGWQGGRIKSVVRRESS